MKISFKGLYFKPMIVLPFSLLNLIGKVFGEMAFPRGSIQRSGLSEWIKLPENSGFEIGGYVEHFALDLRISFQAMDPIKCRPFTIMICKDVQRTFRDDDPLSSYRFCPQSSHVCSGDIMNVDKSVEDVGIWFVGEQNLVE